MTSSPLDEIDDFLKTLINSDNNDIEFERADLGYMQWMKYPEILKWLGFYLMTEFHYPEFPLPPRKVDLELCENDFYRQVETQFPNETFYIIIKCICIMYQSNWMEMKNSAP